MPTLPELAGAFTLMIATHLIHDTIKVKGTRIIFFIFMAFSGAFVFVQRTDWGIVMAIWGSIILALEKK
jgi:uncharacterized membrane protein YvlD (DUF360 family)